MSGLISEKCMDLETIITSVHIMRVSLKLGSLDFLCNWKLHASLTYFIAIQTLNNKFCIFQLTLSHEKDGFCDKYFGKK